MRYIRGLSLKGFNLLTKGNARFDHEEFNIKIEKGFLSHMKSIKGSAHSNNEDRLVFKIKKGVGFAFAIDGISQGGFGNISSSLWKDIIEREVDINPFGKKAVDIVKKFRRSILKNKYKNILKYSVFSGIIFFKEKDYWRYIFVYSGDGGFSLLGNITSYPSVEYMQQKMPIDVWKHILPDGNLVYPLILDKSFKIKHCSVLNQEDLIKEDTFNVPIPKFVPIFEFRKIGDFTPFIVYTDGITEAYLGFAGKYSYESYSRFMKGLINDEIDTKELMKYAKKFRKKSEIPGWDDMSYIVIKKE